MQKIAFTMTQPASDRRYYVDEDDVRVVLARLPVELTSHLRAVHFNDRSRGGRVAGYVNRRRREIALTALAPRLSLSPFLTPPQHAAMFGAVKGVQWPPLAVRRFILYDVLLHELGHLQVIRPAAQWTRLKFAREPLAQEFANTWRERLWSVPFEHEDPVHNAPSAEEMATLRSYPEAHAEYKHGLAAADREAARAHHARAVDLFPEHALALLALGLYTLGEGAAGLEHAVGYFRRALRVDPLLDRARFFLGVTLMRIGEIEEACTHLERGRRQIWLSATGHAVYADALADGGFFEAAERAFERAMAMDPGRARTFCDFACAIWDLAPPTEESAARALSLFERAVGMDPMSATLHLYLARALATRPGEGARAAHHAEEALRLGPGDEDAVRLLELLRRPLPSGRAAHLTRKTFPQRKYER